MKAGPANSLDLALAVETALPAILAHWRERVRAPMLADDAETLLLRFASHLRGEKRAAAEAGKLPTLAHLIKEYALLRNVTLTCLQASAPLPLNLQLLVQDFFDQAIERATAGASAAAVETEVQLRSSQDRFGRVSEATGLGVWYCDLPFAELNWNREVKEHFFLPPEAPVTIDTFYERIHPEDREPTRLAIAESNRTGERYDIVYRTTNPANPQEWRYIRAMGWTAYDENRRPISFDGFTLDITDNKRVEAAGAEAARALVESENRLRLALKASRIGIFDYDVATDDLLLSDQLAEDWGLPPGTRHTIMGAIGALVHPEDRAMVETNLKAALEQRTPYDYVLRIVRQDSGELRWMHTKAEATFAEDGTPLRLTGTTVDITAQRRAQEEITASAQRFRSLTESIPQIVWSAEPDGHVSWYSRQWYEFTGLRENEPWESVMHPDDIEPTWKIFRASLASGEDYEAEYRFRGKDGHYRWFLGRAVPVRDAAGNILQWLGTNTDINDRVETSKVLKERSELFRLITDTIPHGVWRTNPDGSADYFSQQFSELVGYPVETLLGWGWAELIHPEDRAYVLTAWQEGRDARKPVAAEFRVRSSEGRYRWFISRGNPFFDASGNLIKYYGTWTEIDEQKTRAHQLQKLAETSLILNSTRPLAEKLSTVTEQSREILGAHQAALRLEALEAGGTAVNNSSLSTKYSGQGGNLLDPSHTGLYDLLRRLNHPVRFTKAEIEANPGYREALGPHPAPSHGFLAAPLRNARGEAVGVLQLSDKYEGDFTEADAGIFAQLAQIASAAIENAQLLEREQAAVLARDEFLSIASHELKTPLTTLKLQSQIFQRMVEKGDSRAYAPDRLNSMMEQTNRQVNRLNRLVDDMLDISRIRTGKLSFKLQPALFGDLVREAADRMAPHFRKEGRAVPEMDLKVNPRVNLDSVRMEQVVNNLLTNALRYGEGKPILVHLESRGNRAVLSVRDQGMGIERANLEKIFDRFERAVSANEVSGLGLGLFISRQIVAAHGGRIWAESEVGQGSTFYVELPEHKAQP